MDVGGGGHRSGPRLSVVHGLGEAGEAPASRQLALTCLARPSSLPLVGRQPELGAIETALDTARRGVARLITLTGEPGIGKTRLAQEAVHLASALGFATVWGSGWPESGSPPLWPWEAIIEQLAPVDRIARGIDTALCGDIAEPSAFRPVVDALRTAARTQPVLVVLDDIDANNVEALLLARFAVSSLWSERLVVIVTYRADPTDAAQPANALEELSRVGVTLVPPALEVSHVEILLESAGQPGGDAAVLHGLTGGSPLLVREQLHADGRSRPNGVLGPRLARLSRDDQLALAALAVLGPDGSDRAAAKVIGSTERSIEASRDRAVKAGLMGADGLSSIGLADELRAVVLDEIAAVDQARLHERAAELLADGGPATGGELVRIAEHRVAAAEMRPDERAAAAAVAASTAAAAFLTREVSYDAAAALLRSATVASELVGLPVPCSAQIALAQADLVGGRTHAAREGFRQALADAENGGDPIAFAEAALGLGGLWVFEHRTAADAAYYRDLLARARPQLGLERPDLGARLAARLAAEAFYAGCGPLSDVRAAVVAARRTGDQRALAESLSVLHNCIGGPSHADERLAVAEEIVTVASADGDVVLRLMGALWRTIDLITLGDPGGMQAVADLRRRATAVQARAVLYVVDVLDVMLLVRAGRIDDAEAAATACFERGAAVGKDDAAAYFGAHLFALRWLQDRTDDLADQANELSRSPSTVVNDPAYPAAVAALAAKAGDRDEAYRQIDALRAGDFEALTRSSNALVALFSIVDAARSLDDAALAAEAYAALTPYAAMPVVASLGSVCFGPTERVLGLAAEVMGDAEGAIGHFERAVVHARQLGYLPVLAIVEGELALARLKSDHGTPDDALALADQAASALDSMGLIRRAATLRAAAAGLADREAVFRLLDSGAEILADDKQIWLPDLVGLRYLARLLIAPGLKISSSDLVGGVSLGFAERERARVAAHRAIRRLLGRVTTISPALGQSLSASIQTGFTCSFEPVVGCPVRWRVEDHRGTRA